MSGGTYFWSQPDTATRPRSSVDEIADVAEVLDATDALAVDLAIAPRVIRELERRGHTVRRHAHEDGQRIVVYVERTPA